MSRSTIEAFFETAQKYKDRVALRHKVDGSWREWTWTQYADEVRRAGRALIALGLQKGGAVAIVGPNRPEWLFFDLAALMAGVVPAPIYTTSTAEQVGYIAGHADATVALVHDKAQLEKLRSQKAQTPKLKQYILMVGDSDGAEVMSWKDFLAKGEDKHQAELDARFAAHQADDIATLIYTSGTTGHPKAVMITHGNVLFVAQANIKLGEFTEHDHTVSYLPLSHIAEQVLSIHTPVVAGSTLSFCERLDQLGDYLREVHPTVLFGVPRVWEKIQGKMQEAGASAPALRKKIVAWARGVGLRAGMARFDGKSPPWNYGIAKKLVFSKVRERLGLERCRMCFSGAAPISRATLEFFLALDIPIYEVYGMSEVTGPGTLSTPSAARLGYVGKTIPGTEIKIAEDGEILMKGPHTFKGYLKNPEATAETLIDGWVHSGDVGEFDDKGFLRITDRKKDLIKTSGGKYVAPQGLEGMLKGIPGVGQAVVIGDNRKYCVALITPDPEKANGRSLADLAGDAALQKQIADGIQTLNGKLAPYESIKKWKLLATEFTVESGELTPSLKVKRKVVTQRYEKEIDSLYAGSGE